MFLYLPLIAISYLKYPKVLRKNNFFDPTEYFLMHFK